MLIQAILSLVALTAGAFAAESNDDIIIWTKSGIRYRAASITLPPVSTVTKIQTATATIRLRILPSPRKRSVKRAYLNQWTLQGYVADHDNLPSLISPFPYELSSDEVSGAACMDTCDERGNTLAALQNGNECWCGDESQASNVTLVNQSRCNIACAAESGETCGAKDSLTIYTKAG